MSDGGTGGTGGGAGGDGAGGAGGSGGAGGGGAQMVPYSRFSDVVTARDAALAQVGQLQEQLAQAQARGATVDTLTAQLNTEKAARELAEGRYTTFTKIAKRGITEPDIVGAIESAFNGLPKKDRPADAGAWLDTFKAGEGEDPAEKLKTAPVLLRPHLAAAWNLDGAGGGGRKIGGHGGGGGSGNRPGAGQPLTQERIWELTQQVLRGEITQEQYDQAVAKGG